MSGFCQYCDQLETAIDSPNYCSHRKQNVNEIESNAYYFSNQSMHSGQHESRFSVRAVYNGYQYYEVENRSYVVKPDNCLVVQAGEKFEHFVDQDKEAHAIIVAFNPDFIQYYLYFMNHSSEQMLDRTFEKVDACLNFYEGSFRKTQLLNAYLQTIISNIKLGDKDPIYFQNLFVNILDELVGIEKEINDQINSISALKSKTRVELYRRLNMAKDYIDLNLNSNLSLEVISKESCLSPFHFLRTFSEFYGTTPYQYILSERLKKANFLIEKTSQEYNQIIRATGFEHKRTFQRAYKKEFGITPFMHMSSVRS